jgi:hypothetical protein
MCGRYTYLLTWDDIRHLYGLTAQGAEGADGGGGGGEAAAAEEAPPDFRKRYNHAPTERAPVVRINNILMRSSIEAGGRQEDASRMATV